ncbi:MAG: hypothetical protein M0Q95_11280 [Porticoccaceae bacterium]|nr:hypothetical protein [Porticoccaceae bacterium]
MTIRAITIILVAMMLSGCPPKNAMLKQREVQHIEAGLGVDGTKKILSSNEEVDALSSEVTQLLNSHGFELLYSSTSWGLQPLTGHTQNLSFRLPGTNAIHCYVQISKKEFRVKFRELEREPQSDEFATTDYDFKIAEQAVISLNVLAKQKFKGRSVRISKFDRAESPNK